jgi:hypothetical protein
MTAPQRLIPRRLRLASIRLCPAKVVFEVRSWKIGDRLAGCLALVQDGPMVVLLGCGQDREGPPRAKGKLLSGHGPGQDGSRGDKTLFRLHPVSSAGTVTELRAAR